MAIDLLKTTKLLLVDDDPSMVRLLNKIIERQFKDQIELTCLSDPRLAREQIGTQLVDILITDLEMPGVNGLDLLRCVKRRNPWTQVLLMTGHSTLDSLADALELGATDYRLKPLDQTQLLKLVDDTQQRLLRWREALAGTLSAAQARLSLPQNAEIAADPAHA
ncbi:MAG: response regulator [Thermoguttaceae bacterium]